MPDLYLVLDLIVVVALIVLAITVLVKDMSVELNRIFSLFSVCIAIWIIANYLSTGIHNASQTAVIANYFVFSFSLAATVFLLKFVVTLANDQKARRIFNKIQIPLFIVVLLSATPLVANDVHVQGQLYAVEFGPLALLYFVTLLLTVGGTIYVVRRNIKRTHGIQRERLRVIIKSFWWTFPILLMAMAIIPATTGWFGLTNIGILPMLILVYGLYYSVVKHRLFDLRLVVLRAVVYVLTLGIISAFYGLATHYILSLSDRAESVLVRDAVNIGLIVVAVLAYAPLKGVFNRLTNKLFYRDAYDPQQFFNEFNQALVAEVNLEKLLQNSTALIAATLKAQYCSVLLQGKHPSESRVIGTVEKKFTDIYIEQADALIHKIEGEMIVTDQLSPAHENLRVLLSGNNVAIIARMTPGNTNHNLGYVVLGPKKSGIPYNRQDLHVIEAVTNELVIATQNALRFEEIQNFNVTLQQEVNDATRRLRQSNEKLRIIDQTKDDFVSMASHQLRTPLTSIKGYISMVLDGDAGNINDNQRKMLEQAFISSQRMTFLVADLLNLSRLKTGKFIIERTPINLSDMVDQEMGQLRENAKSRDLTIDFKRPESFPEIMLDETKTRQVVMNFLDNAVYYTPAGGTITIELNETPKTVEFMVHDTGIGVPKAEQPHLFAKFYRAPNAKRARPDGTGLGLFMAKKVTVAQGGALIFKSEEGKGSTFGFSFPKALEADPTAAETIAKT